MSDGPAGAGIRAVLLDIEGTTTPVSFVYGILFPFARERIRRYLEQAPASDDELLAAVARLRDEHEADVAAGHAPPPWSEHPPGAKLASVVAYVHWLMDRDRKSPALKLLQGKVWERGYAAGELKGEVFPDVPSALERWTRGGVSVGIFSSGSVLAQKLLFARSTAGDLTGFLRWHFDTGVGPKTDPASYGRIADATGVPAGRILFVSDVEQELDAARAAGLQTALCVRPGAASPSDPARHVIIQTFDEIAV